MKRILGLQPNRFETHPNGTKFARSTFGMVIVAIALSLIVFADFSTNRIAAQDDPSLGVTNTIEQIVLPGTELTHKKVDPDETPLIVRVVATFPHGDSFRYDISYFGLTEGEYDLKDFLERIDGSSTDDLPSIPVTIRSILEAGQIEPNQLEIGGLSRFGGYWQLVFAGLAVWLVVLFALILVGRKRKQLEEIEVKHELTLAELLRPSVEKAIAGTLSQEKYAELERLLLAFWQKRLDLTNMEPARALQKIREHEESGPLVRQLEEWLHSPPKSTGAVNVAKLLEPYQQYGVEDASDSALGNREGKDG